MSKEIYKMVCVVDDINLSCWDAREKLQEAIQERLDDGWTLRAIPAHSSDVTIQAFPVFVRKERK